MGVKASRNCDKQQQATTTSPITMGTLKPSPIAMDAINPFIMRHQSAHKIPSNATWKAMAISLKATRWPCWRMQQGHSEGVVSITMILIPQQRLLPQGCQLPQCMLDKRKLQSLADQRRSQGLYAQHDDGNYHHHQHGWRKQHKLHNDGGRGDNKHYKKKSLPEH